MNCTNCSKEIHVGENTLVSSVNIRDVEELDIEVTCPHCGKNHYTFIPVAHLTTD